MKILIVGGGIGGLTLAAFLKDSNIDYEIIEKSAAEPAGYLLVMWDNARDILKKLGLAPRFDTGGTPIHTYSIRNGKGRVLRDYSLNDFYVNYGTAITMVARRDLCHWLMSCVDEAKIRRGVALTGLVEKGEKVQATFSDETVKEYDAMIGADGVHSSVRNLLFKKDAEEYENWRSWWAWIDRKFGAPATVIEYLEPGEVVVVFSGGDKTLAILSAPANHKIWDIEEGRIERLKEIFKDEPEVVRMLSDKRDTDAMPSDLLEVQLGEWAKGRVALIGDAAHSFGPHAGLGASMAMEDAYVLASKLMQVGSRYQTIETALKAYERVRKERIRAATRLNNRMRLWALIKSKALRRLTNALAPYLPERFLVANYNRLLKEEI